MQALFALAFLSCISVGKLNHRLPEDFVHGFWYDSRRYFGPFTLEVCFSCKVVEAKPLQYVLLQILC